MKKQKTELERKREVLTDYLNFGEPEVIEVLYDVLTVSQHPQKNNLLKFIGYTDEEISKFDSAVPQPYADKIKEIYPRFKALNHCYNYNVNTFGEMYNVVEAFGQAIFDKLRNKA